MIKRHLDNFLLRPFVLNTYFNFLYRLGLCVVSYNVGFKLKSAYYYPSLRNVLIPLTFFSLLSRNIINYLISISNNANTIGFFGTFGLRSTFILTEQLLPYITNMFLTGLGSCYGNFVNWVDVVLSQSSRLNMATWENYYLNSDSRDLLTQRVGAIIVNKFFYKSVVSIPRIAINSENVINDFFLPCSRLSSRLELFFLSFLLLKIHVFFRNRLQSDRMFWGATHFRTYYRERNLAIGRLPFNYVFRIYGRRHKAMQLWEYYAINKVFHYSSFKVAKMKKILYIRPDRRY